jgi:hypothetical protein
MFKEVSPIAYDPPAGLKKCERQKDRGPPYLVYNGTLTDCVRELMGKPVKGIALYDNMTKPRAAFDEAVLSPGDAAEIAMRKDVPKA